MDNNSSQSARLTSNQQGTVVCDCAATPPTMPTYRKHHLPTCPVWVVENAGNVQHQVTEPVTLRASSVLESALAKLPTGRRQLLWSEAVAILNEIERLRAALERMLPAYIDLFDYRFGKFDIESGIVEQAQEALGKQPVETFGCTCIQLMERVRHMKADPKCPVHGHG